MRREPQHPAVLDRDRLAASRALALFCAAGGTWLAVCGLLPGVAGNRIVILIAVALGVVCAAGGLTVWRRAAQLPVATLVAAPHIAVWTIAALNLLTEDASTGSQLFLLWPVLFAASFLSRRQTTLVLLEVLVAESVVMGALEPASLALVDTLALVVAYAMAAIAVLTFRTRVELLLGALSAQAREDALTGLPNRRAFDDHLARLAAHATRTGEPLSLLAIDVDLFKEVNDAHGHGAGDQVLRSVADALRRSGREADLVARVGGDEFAMILPGCDFAGAASVGEKVREHVSVQTFRAGRVATVSVGAATMPDMAGDAEDLLAAADAALYAAKLAGRDRLELAGVLGLVGRDGPAVDAV